MNDLPGHRPRVEPARSFDLVVDAYDRARPTYPQDAVTWLLAGVGDGGPGTRPEVVELGAGTGKLTEQLLARRCTVTATDPSEVMLSRLARRAPGARVVAGAAEHVPVRSRSADLVVAAQAFHWFDAGRMLPEAARVLRPGGHLAVVWNSRDERIPWVKRLGRIIGTTPQQDDPTAAIDETAMFQAVDRATFRFWHPLHRESLHDLVLSRSNVAMMSGIERDRVLRKVDDLYDEYGRGADGMLLPYVTTVCRTAVLPWALPPEPEPEPAPSRVQAPGRTEPVDDGLLIDFR